MRNKIIVRTELPGNSQREAPAAAGQGQPRPCSSQSQVHCSASLKFQLFHYFHLYLTPRGAEPRSDPPGKAQAPARALGASSDSPTTFGRGVVTGQHSHGHPDGHGAWAVNPSHSTVCIAQSQVQSPSHGPRVGVFFYFFSTGHIRTIPPGSRLTTHSSHHCPGARNTLWASLTATGEEVQGIPRLLHR